MRQAILYEEELQEIKKLHESILSKSSHGLFHSMGKIIGESIAKEVSDRNKFFEEVARIMKERNIVENIVFTEQKVTAKESIEVNSAQTPTCDILRGIIVALYREYYNKKVYVEEIACESMGNEACVFEIREEVI